MRKTLFSILSVGTILTATSPAQAFSFPLLNVKIMVPKTVVAPVPGTRIAPPVSAQGIAQRVASDGNRHCSTPEHQVVYVGHHPGQHLLIEHRGDRHHPGGKFDRFRR